MASMASNKVNETADRRIATEIIWDKIKAGEVVELKHIRKKGQKEGGCKMVETRDKYKVINKQHHRILFQKVENGRFETFTFADFITGDISV